jgi:error-prone DNA polymerase
VSSGLERQSATASQVTVAGLVVARQRPETASGVVFMLIEDEHGPINLIVPPALYARRRHIVRAEPLILAHGRLERPPAGGGTINVLVRELRTLDDELAGIAAAQHRCTSPARARPSLPRAGERGRAAGFSRRRCRRQSFGCAALAAPPVPVALRHPRAGDA